MTSSRIRLVAYALVLAGGCVSPSKYERADVTLERIELRDAWLQTAVPFGLAFCLVLLLVILYHRRNAPDRLNMLFRPRRAPHLAAAVRTWWRNRQELAPFQNLLSVQRYRARQEERAARRITKRVAEYEAERVERETLRVEEVAHRALPPLGQPRLGFLSRVGAGFITGVVLTVILLLPFGSSADPSGFGPLFLILGGGMGLLISLVASVVCAALVSAVAEKSIWLSTICGAAGALVGSMIVPEVWTLAGPIIVLLGGAAIGLAIGVADQSSRRPDTSARASGPRAD